MVNVRGCGEWGHPRRECPTFLARMNSNDGGYVAALKGVGKQGKGIKGKGWKGYKGYKGKFNGKGNGSYI